LLLVQNEASLLEGTHAKDPVHRNILHTPQHPALEVHPHGGNTIPEHSSHLHPLYQHYRNLERSAGDIRAFGEGVLIVKAHALSERFAQID
jgi:hypothetical protein